MSARPLAHPDFLVVSHGPEHAILLPQSARADRYLDACVSFDCAEEAWCDAGLKVSWPNLRGTLVAIRSARLTVEE